ncbi:DUF6429 family protein, partial [Alteromonas sp. 1_MG-2023]|uniref:DUF6429 family protein n=2 Tax=Alteromonas TaxID=226 RepID=UPI0026E2A81F
SLAGTQTSARLRHCCRRVCAPYLEVSSHMKMETAVEIDEDKIDEAALALFYLTLHDKFGRAWKQIDWSITDRLYEKGYIHDPVGKSKSVVLTEEGLAKSEELFKKLFVKSE